MKIKKIRILQTLFLATTIYASSIYATPVTHNFYKGTQDSSPYLTTHESLNGALEQIQYLRLIGAKSLFTGKISALKIELLDGNEVNTHLSNTFVSLGAFGASIEQQYLDSSDMSQSKTYELSILQFKDSTALDSFKSKLEDNEYIHYEGPFSDLTLDMRSSGLNFNAVDKGIILIHSKAREVGKGAISIAELQNIQEKLNQLHASQEAGRTTHNEELKVSNRISKIFSGSETEIFNDFKFETDAYAKAAKDGYGDCEILSDSNQIDLEDLWERDVYSVVCYKL